MCLFITQLNLSPLNCFMTWDVRSHHITVRTCSRHLNILTCLVIDSKGAGTSLIDKRQQNTVRYVFQHQIFLCIFSYGECFPQYILLMQCTLHELNLACWEGVTNSGLLPSAWSKVQLRAFTPSLRQPVPVPVLLSVLLGVLGASAVMNDSLRWPMPPLSYGSWTYQTIAWITPSPWPSTPSITHRTLRHKRDRQHVSRTSDPRDFNGFSNSFNC